MFVQNLNLEQQSALLYLADQVIRADDNLIESELALLNVLSSQCENGVQAKSVEVSQLAQLFDTEKAKCSLLLELLGIAHADEDYQQDEKVLIAEYANSLNVSNEKLQTLDNWVIKQFALSKEIEILLNQ